MTLRPTLSSAVLHNFAGGREAILDEQFRNNVMREGLEALYFIRPVFCRSRSSPVSAAFSCCTRSAHALPVMP
jgi:hypothetical protein